MSKPVKAKELQGTYNMETDEELTSNHLNHLIATASALQQVKHSSLLKSHLLTQCLEISNYRLKLCPKIFGPNVRCSNCCTSWNEGRFNIKVRKNISKSAKKRLKNNIKNKAGSKTEGEINKAKKQLDGKIFDLKCLMCNKITEIIQKKRNSSKKTMKVKVKTPENPKSEKTLQTEKNVKLGKKLNKRQNDKNAQSYYQTFDSTNSVVAKETVQKESNVKRKKKQKDKFAGLCQAACEASKAGMTRPSEKHKDSLLNLFLKPT